MNKKTKYALVALGLGVAYLNWDKLTTRHFDGSEIAPIEESVQQSLNEAEEYRINTLGTVYNFVNEINSNPVTHDGKPLMFTMEEGLALYIYFNNMNKTEAYNLFGSTEVKYDDIKKEYESALLKLRVFYALSDKESTITSLIKDEESKKLYSEFEEAHIKYNQQKPEDRVDDAKAIIELFKEVFVNGSNLPYESIEPGVARALLTGFGTLDQNGWRNSTVKFPMDIRKILNDIETSLCSRTNESVENTFKELSITQIAYKVSNKPEENTANYPVIFAYLNQKLMNNKTFADNNLDANNPEIFTAYFNGNIYYSGTTPVLTNNVQNKNKNTDNKETTTKKKVVKKEKKDLSSKELDKEIKDMPKELQDSAKDQKESIENKIEKENKNAEEAAKDEQKGYNDYYKRAFDAGKDGRDKPNVPKSGNDDYDKGAKKGNDAGYSDGKEVKQKMDEQLEKEKEETKEIQKNVDGPLYDENGKEISSLESAERNIAIHNAEVEKTNLIAMSEFLKSLSNTKDINNDKNGRNIG